MSRIQSVARFKIHSGKLDEFKRLRRALQEHDVTIFSPHLRLTD